MPQVLAYWPIRGLAQPIRLLLNYCGEEFEDKRFEIGAAGESWFSIKHNLGLDFPNLPYFIDGDIKVTQSNAILRYIARKHNLCGETEPEKVAVDVVMEQIMDLRNGLVKMCYDPKGDKDGYVKGLPAKLEVFSKYLGGKTWMTGDKIAFPDFAMYEMLDQHRILFPGSLDEYKNLLEYVDRFEELPAIKTYMDSDNFLKRQINGPMATVNN